MEKEPVLQRIKTSKAFALDRMLSVYFFVALCIIAGLINRDFFLWSTWQSMFSTAAPMGVVALGMMVVLISGGLDLTAEQGVPACAAIGGLVFLVSGNIWLTFLTCILAGLALGALNGVIITKLKIEPFVTTLATMALCQGIAYLLSNGKVTDLTSAEGYNALTSTLLFSRNVTEFVGEAQISVTYGVPLSFVLFLALCVITHLLMTQTRFGTYVYGIGGKEESVRFAGVNINKYKMLIYIFAGFCTAIGTCITLSRVGSIAPNTTGAPLMDVVGATIIGGTSVSGGKGRVFGTIMGVLIMVVISQLFYFLNIPTLWRDVFKGAIILLALIADRVVNMGGQKKAALAH